MDSTHDEARCAAMRCDDVKRCDSGREIEERRNWRRFSMVHSHICSICGQSLRAVLSVPYREGNGKSSRPLAAYRALSRQQQQQRSHNSSAALSSAERKRQIKSERNERLSRVKVIDKHRVFGHGLWHKMLSKRIMTSVKEEQRQQEESRRVESSAYRCHKEAAAQWYRVLLLPTRCRQIFTQQAGKKRKKKSEKKPGKNETRITKSDNIAGVSYKCCLRVVYLSHFKVFSI